MSVTNFKKIFISCFIPYLILVSIFFVLMSLGFWQIHRADEKKTILQSFHAQQTQSFREWDSSSPMPIQFSPVFFKGRIGQQLFYLDNQFYQHQVGYNLLVPVEVDRDKVVLVDMGWMKSLSNRQQLPEVAIHTSQKIFKGTIYYPQLSSVDFGQFVDLHQGNCYRIERLNPQEVSKILNRFVYPWVLRLSGEQPKELKREWPLIAVTPQRHYAYALQWFLMAFIVFVIILWRLLK
jgi:surfeit locus 1 family protein